VLTSAGELPAPRLVAGMTTSADLTLVPGSTQASVTIPFAAIAPALGDRAGTEVGGFAIARVPSLQMPAFTHRDDGAPAPLMVPLVECAWAPTQTPVFALPLARFPLVLYARLANQRELGNTTLQSNLVGVTTGTGTAFAVNLRVPLATAATLMADATAIDLWGPSDAIALPPVQRLELRLGFEPPEGESRLDYFEAALYRVDRTQSAPLLQRVYVGVDPSAPIRVDPGVLVAGHEYVFEIRSYRGRPGSAARDFTTNSYPQVAGAIFTRTFRAP
jgi:hypothetical protein